MAYIKPSYFTGTLEDVVQTLSLVFELAGIARVKMSRGFLLVFAMLSAQLYCGESREVSGILCLNQCFAYIASKVLKFF